MEKKPYKGSENKWGYNNWGYISGLVAGKDGSVVDGGFCWGIRCGSGGK